MVGLDGSFKSIESQYGRIGRVLQDHRIPAQLSGKGPQSPLAPLLSWAGSPPHQLMPPRPHPWPRAAPGWSTHTALGTSLLPAPQLVTCCSFKLTTKDRKHRTNKSRGEKAVQNPHGMRSSMFCLSSAQAWQLSAPTQHCHRVI